jgi:hypothetical protein
MKKNYFLLSLSVFWPFSCIRWLKLAIHNIQYQQIENILIRRKESDTYLATVSRHRWSSWITMKKD